MGGSNTKTSTDANIVYDDQISLQDASTQYIRSMKHVKISDTRSDICLYIIPKVSAKMEDMYNDSKLNDVRSRYKTVIVVLLCLHSAQARIDVPWSDKTVYLFYNGDSSFNIEHNHKFEHELLALMK